MNNLTIVDRVSAVSRNELRDQYIARSRPVIITDAVERWPAVRKWSLDYFEQRFGQRAVGGVNDQPGNFGEAIRMIRASLTGGKPAPYLHQIPLPVQLPELLADLSPTLTYVEKDRMTSRLMPRSFRYPNGNLELFIGGPGAGFGLLHYDLYHLHAFTVQIVGHKTFRLFSPADTPFLSTSPTHPHLSEIPNAFAVDLARYPAFAQASPIDLVLGPGETLFVPSGWWHTTKMAELTISVAYNTLDRYNWPGFVKDYERGVVEILALGPLGRLRATYLRGIGPSFLARGM